MSGYHVLVSDKDPKNGKQCVVIERGTEKPGPFGNVMQKIDAASFRGKRVRYRAAVRTEIDGRKGRAQLWMRVELPRKKGQRNVGFSDNVHDRPNDKRNWDYYAIVGDIAEDAETINVGMFLSGTPLKTMAVCLLARFNSPLPQPCPSPWRSPATTLPQPHDRRVRRQPR